MLHGWRGYGSRMTTHRVELNLNGGIKGGTVVVDDQDLSSLLSGVQVDARANRPTAVALIMRPGAAIPAILSECEVSILEEGPPVDWTVLVAQFLDRVDPMMLEADVLSRFELGESMPTMAMALQVLKGYLNASPTT